MWTLTVTVADLGELGVEWDAGKVTFTPATIGHELSEGFVAWFGRHAADRVEATATGPSELVGLVEPHVAFATVVQYLVHEFGDTASHYRAHGEDWRWPYPPVPEDAVA